MGKEKEATIGKRGVTKDGDVEVKVNTMGRTWVGPGVHYRENEGVRIWV